MNEEVYNQIVAIVQAAMGGDKKAEQQIAQIMQAAEQGDQQAKQLANVIQEIAGKIQKAKFGAKLGYISSLNGKCPEGYEVEKFMSGGCVKCAKKKINKLSEGSNVKKRFTKGKKTKKCQFGGLVVRDGQIRPGFYPSYRLTTLPYGADDKMYPNITYTVNNMVGDEGNGFIQHLQLSENPDDWYTQLIGRGYGDDPANYTTYMQMPEHSGYVRNQNPDLPIYMELKPHQREEFNVLQDAIDEQSTWGPRVAPAWNDIEGQQRAKAEMKQNPRYPRKSSIHRSSRPLGLQEYLKIRKQTNPVVIKHRFGMFPLLHYK